MSASLKQKVIFINNLHSYDPPKGWEISKCTKMNLTTIKVFLRGITLDAAI